MGPLHQYFPSPLHPQFKVEHRGCDLRLTNLAYSKQIGERIYRLKTYFCQISLLTSDDMTKQVPWTLYDKKCWTCIGKNSLCHSGNFLFFRQTSKKVMSKLKHCGQEVRSKVGGIKRHREWVSSRVIEIPTPRIRVPGSNTQLWFWTPVCANVGPRSLGFCYPSWTPRWSSQILVSWFSMVWSCCGF